MSLPYEIVNAQKRVWESFVNREIPLKLWPKHFIGPVQLEMLYDELEGLKAENERLKKARAARMNGPIKKNG